MIVVEMFFWKNSRKYYFNKMPKELKAAEFEKNVI
jgi:hypothetical protein